VCKQKLNKTHASLQATLDVGYGTGPSTQLQYEYAVVSTEGK